MINIAGEVEIFQFPLTLCVELVLRGSLCRWHFGDLGGSRVCCVGGV